VGVAAYTPVLFTVSNIRAIDAFGSTVQLDGAGYTVVIDPTLPAGTTNVSNEMHVNLFPNPANGLFTISTSSMTSAIVITDATGRQVFSVQPTSLQIQIDAGAFAKGMYFVTIHSESGVITKPLVIAE
jgi:hypothetical protein